MPSDCTCAEPHTWAFNQNPGVRCLKHPPCPFAHSTWNSVLKQVIFPPQKTYVVGAFIKANGQPQYRTRCSGCGKLSVEIKKSDMETLVANGIQFGFTRTPHAHADTHVCQVKGCGRTDIEMQHWMPQAILGEEANLWPITPLCVDCHRLWHSLVWPGPNLGKPTEILEPWHGKASETQ